MNGAYLHTAIMLIAAIGGLAIGCLVDASSAAILIEPLLIAMLFVIFLCVDVSEVRRAFTNIRFTMTALLINFVWTPIFALMLGMIFSEVDVRIGLMMLLVTPCTDWYLVFTAAAKGNVVQSSSILPFNLILQIVLMPVYLMLFFDVQISLDMSGLVMSMAMILAIPFLAALAVRLLMTRVAAVGRLGSGMIERGDLLQLMFLCAAIVAMFASESAELLDHWELFLALLIPLAVFFAANYVVADVFSKIQRFDYRDATSLIFTSMARNSPLSLAIAVVAFPDSPLILLVLVIAPLIELPILSFAAGYRSRKLTGIVIRKMSP